MNRGLDSLYFIKSFLRSHIFLLFFFLTFKFVINKKNKKCDKVETDVLDLGWFTKAARTLMKGHLK